MKVSTYHNTGQSSGEKQIFVMSMYWAMMNQSKSELPFIIARLVVQTQREIRLSMDLSNREDQNQNLEGKYQSRRHGRNQFHYARGTESCSGKLQTFILAAGGRNPLAAQCMPGAIAGTGGGIL